MVILTLTKLTNFHVLFCSVLGMGYSGGRRLVFVRAGIMGWLERGMRGDEIGKRWLRGRERRKARTTKVEKKLADAVACLLN